MQVITNTASVVGLTIVADVTAAHCETGVVCWMEAYPGTAAWLQGAGTFVALVAAIGAYFRFRHEGFRVRAEARCDRDGKHAVLLLSNIGRTPGAIEDYMIALCKRVRIPGRPPALGKGERPSLICPGLTLPWLLKPGEALRFTLEKKSHLFTNPDVRIVIITGASVQIVKIRALDQGRLALPTGLTNSSMEPSTSSAAPMTASSSSVATRHEPWTDNPWQAARRELDELKNLREIGSLSALDLWIGRYRCLRRVQSLGPPPSRLGGALDREAEQPNQTG